MARPKNPLSLEFILLGFVIQGPIHGYDLYKKVSAKDGIALIWHVKPSYLYALLDKLEKDGLLVSRTVAGANFPTRKEFQITDSGRQKFHIWLTSPVNHGRDMRQEFMAKLYFAQKAESSVYRTLIRSQIQVCRQWLANLAKDLEKSDGRNSFSQVILKYRREQIKAMLAWLESLPPPGQT